MQRDLQKKSEEPMRVEFEAEEGVLEKVRFCGDFFKIPSGVIHALGNYLNGCRLEREELVSRINVFLTRNDIETPGMDAEDFAELFFTSPGSM
jgi:hypothetical protein